ncbi:MAG: hypothetical protein KAH10_08630 [Flavobacteriales bacterium]|nr:hypothetical protein [Flavobacteriales bacterium]
MKKEILIVETITEPDFHIQTTLKIRRSLTTKEKFNHIKALVRNYPNRVYKKGKSTYITVDPYYMEANNVKVGDDINKYDDLHYKLLTIEATNISEFEKEGIKGSLKLNPGTGEPFTHNLNPIYHSTFLAHNDSTQEDILLDHDK